jgi:hypothetical protein
VYLNSSTHVFWRYLIISAGNFDVTGGRTDLAAADFLMDRVIKNQWSQKQQNELNFQYPTRNIQCPGKEYMICKSV